jgi:hypothetical protein
MGKLLITIVGLLVSVRGIRIYSRTGLKGELLIAVAGFVFVLAYQANDMTLGIIGYIIINIGMVILFKTEKIKWKAVFGPLNYYGRLVGNVPQILNEKESRNAYKVTGIISGILCLLMALEFYRRLKVNNIGELLDTNISGLVEIGFFILAGFSIIGYYLFKKID